MLPELKLGNKTSIYHVGHEFHHNILNDSFHVELLMGHEILAR
ncbi:hypothetical protein BTN50_0018 [Candidatus Enterovibrio altilux]|uniref:Uncharacterized protein n=1 Tax=Candidatus Enterovibrio altilux TaxID=1927128 RepID=A0A291B6D8_9GAMM|nr:hypothetical protein BTN50_0018 [Candidatus Enterovibrio luxaltus]